MIIVARAIAITSAVGARSFTPCMKAATQLSGARRPMMPTPIAIDRNSAAISSMYQSNFTTPTTIEPSASANSASTAPWRPVMRSCVSAGGCSWRRVWSST